jgi:hypothetical protein
MPVYLGAAGQHHWNLRSIRHKAGEILSL